MAAMIQSENLITLCAACHGNVHRGFQRSFLSSIEHEFSTIEDFIAVEAQMSSASCERQHAAKTQ